MTQDEIDAIEDAISNVARLAGVSDADTDDICRSLRHDLWDAHDREDQ